MQRKCYFLQSIFCRVEKQMEEDGQHGGETMRRNISASAINKNCANNLHNSRNNDKKQEMTYFRKSGQNVLTSAVCSAIISKLSLMRRHIQKKSKDNRRHGMRQSVLEKLLDGKKKVVDKADRWW